MKEIISKGLTLIVFLIDYYKKCKRDKAQKKHEENVDTGVSNVTGGVQYSSREEMLASRSKKTNN